MTPLILALLACCLPFTAPRAPRLPSIRRGEPEAESGASPSVLETLPLAAAARVLLAPGPVALAPPRERRESAWQLDAALGLPDWLDVGGHQRTRYESLDEHFRAGRSGRGHGVFTRTTLHAKAELDGLSGTLELIDSRHFDTPNDLPLNTGIVNTLDVLQASVGARFSDVGKAGDGLEVTFGRQTMDVGSRRLVARNRFRNTINAFTGVHASWEHASGAVLRGFYVLPVQRLPTTASNVRDNDQDWDEERSQVRFFGVHAQEDDVLGPVDAELYVYGLDEEDGRDLATSDRHLWTLGFRLGKSSRPGELDFDLEAAYQTGESRSSTNAANTTDLDHRAELLHASAGYRWEARLDPRLEVLFDYASGDDSPSDGEWNRFDTLYGARRFELGPTGIFGAFARSNLVSPGLRLTLEPTGDTQVMLADRFHYLASERDAWTTSGLVDSTGGSGAYVGNLAEARLRWRARPNLDVEVGAAHLFAGSFVDDAPNATTQGDSTYAYVSTTLAY